MKDVNMPCPDCGYFNCGSRCVTEGTAKYQRELGGVSPESVLALVRNVLLVLTLFSVVILTIVVLS